MICTAHRQLLGQQSENEMGRTCSTYGRDVYTGFWWGSPREREYLEDPGVDGRIILRRIFRKWDVGTWTG